MTGASVKDVGLNFVGVSPAAQGQNAKSVSQSGFQRVWDKQSGKGNADNAAKDAQNPVKKAPGDSLKARDEHLSRGVGAERKTETAKPLEELSEDGMNEAMAVLGTAAAEIPVQVADILGVSLEEVQSAMQELGLDSLELLQPGQLGQLVLTLGGAEDACALLTDETLCSAYQELMELQKETLRAAGEELGLEEPQVAELLAGLEEQAAEMPQSSARQPEIRIEEPAAGEEAGEQSEDGVQTLTQDTASRTEQKDTPQPESGSGEGRRQENTDRGETQNPFLQNLKAAQTQPEVRQTMQSASPWDTDTQDIMRQIMDYMKVQEKADTSDLEMQLHPASLGTLQIHVASKGGVVTANFIAQNEAVKAALESQMIQLQENFEEQGIKVSAIEVTVQAHSFEENLEQGRGSGQNQTSDRRTRTRRINLNETLSMEGMEQADALAADMLAAGGNTVDYTA